MIREQLDDYVKEKYGIYPEILPFSKEDYGVYRHPDTGKWFAILL
jgi:predicted DNA-binding protein (MmcQ/YjbR family)